MSTVSQRAAQKTGFYLIWFILFWPLFGWVGDIRVEQNQSIFEKAAAWSSAIFHVVGSVVTGIFFPIWGVVWGLFAGMIMARRIGARRGLAISPRSTFSYLNTKIFPAAFAIAVAQPVIGYWRIIGTAAVFVFVFSFAVAASKCVKETLADNAVYAQWANRLKNIFGVPEAVWVEQAGLTATAGRLVINPVPDDARTKFASLGPAGVDANIVAVDPNLELAPESTHDRIVIQPATESTISRRQALSESDGLFTGFGEAPVGVPTVAVPQSQPAKEENQPLVLTLEDL